MRNEKVSDSLLSCRCRRRCLATPCKCVVPRSTKWRFSSDYRIHSWSISSSSAHTEGAQRSVYGRISMKTIEKLFLFMFLFGARLFSAVHHSVHNVQLSCVFLVNNRYFVLNHIINNLMRNTFHDPVQGSMERESKNCAYAYVTFLLDKSTANEYAMCNSYCMRARCVRVYFFLPLRYYYFCFASPAVRCCFKTEKYEPHLNSDCEHASSEWNVFLFMHKISAQLKLARIQIWTSSNWWEIYANTVVSHLNMHLHFLEYLKSVSCNKFCTAQGW